MSNVPSPEPRPLRYKDLEYLRYIARQDASVEGLIEECQFLKANALRNDVTSDQLVKAGLKRALMLNAVELVVTPALTPRELDAKTETLREWLTSYQRLEYRQLVEMAIAEDARRISDPDDHLSYMPGPSRG